LVVPWVGEMAVCSVALLAVEKVGPSAVLMVAPMGSWDKKKAD